MCSSHHASKSILARQLHKHTANHKEKLLRQTDKHMCEASVRASIGKNLWEDKLMIVVQLRVRVYETPLIAGATTGIATPKPCILMVALHWTSILYSFGVYFECLPSLAALAAAPCTIEATHAYPPSAQTRRPTCNTCKCCLLTHGRAQVSFASTRHEVDKVAR